jgi:hypothetical protein
MVCSVLISWFGLNSCHNVKDVTGSIPPPPPSPPRNGHGDSSPIYEYNTVLEIKNNLWGLGIE